MAENVEFTASAKAMIQAGEYRYVSSVFEYAPDGRVLRLLHAGLVNNPALDGLNPVKLAALAALYPTEQTLMNELGTSKNLLCDSIATSRARSRLAYLSDMSRCSLRVSFIVSRLPHSNLLTTIFRGSHRLAIPAC